MTKVNENEAAREESPLDMLARSGAQRMLMTALQTEVDEYVKQFAGERDELGRALVVRNGGARTACDDGCRYDRSESATRERQASDRRRAATIHQQDLAAVSSPVEERVGGLAAALLAGALDRRFSRGVAGAP
jgi:hypothetical protein